MYYAIVSKAHSIVEYVAEAESPAEAIAAFDDDVGLGEGAESWQEWLVVKEISEPLRRYLEQTDWEKAAPALAFDDLKAAMVPLPAAELDSALTEGLAPGEAVETYEAWETEDTGHHLVYVPATGRFGAVVVGSGSSGTASWCDASSLEEGLLKYLTGDVD